MILISHDLGVVARYADQVAVMYGGRVIESASAVELYKNPQHPYTEGLLASQPSLEGTPGERLKTIKGQPPDLANLPAGCAFAPRCRHAREECEANKPPLEPVPHDHLRACFGYEK